MDDSDIFVVLVGIGMFLIDIFDLRDHPPRSHLRTIRKRKTRPLHHIFKKASQENGGNDFSGDIGRYGEDGMDTLRFVTYMEERDSKIFVFTNEELGEAPIFGKIQKTGYRGYFFSKLMFFSSKTDIGFLMRYLFFTVDIREHRSRMSTTLMSLVHIHVQ